MKTIYVLALSILIITHIPGQELKKRNQNKMVNPPAKVKQELLSYLIQQKQDVPDVSSIHIVNILNKKDNEYKNDIYYFFVPESHTTVRMFINNNNRIKIFHSFFIDEILKEYIDYIHKEKLSEELQVRYLTGIAKYMESLQRAPGLIKITR